jgi:hypothetical protein
MQFVLFKINSFLHGFFPHERDLVYVDMLKSDFPCPTILIFLVQPLCGKIEPYTSLQSSLMFVRPPRLE